MLLNDKLRNKKLILASKSPRRHELMKGAGIAFTPAGGYETDESYPAGMPAAEVPEYLARRKSESYPHALAHDEILITADTVVILDGAILGKPRDRDEAAGMLGRLSGREHTVVTGVCLRGADKSHSFSAATLVRFRSLGRDEIEYYVGAYRPYDKAGAYGIQEWIGYVGIESVEGSYFNVVGLPVQTLYVNLLKFTE